VRISKNKNYLTYIFDGIIPSLFYRLFLIFQHFFSSPSPPPPLQDGDDERVCGVTVEDALTKERYNVRGKCVVNATGPFVDALRKLDDAEAKEIIVAAGGVHVVLPDHFSPDNMGLFIPKTKDGRVLFFLPWEGATIAGERPPPPPRFFYWLLRGGWGFLLLQGEKSS
jgi:hypothetical protein